METLTQRLEAVMDAFPAKSALYCVDLTTGKPIAAIREDSQVVSASTIKVALLCCALQDVMEGKLSLQQFVPIHDGDYCDDTQVFEPTYRQDGASLWEMLYWMIVSSDNTAPNGVISLLGYDHVGDYCRKMGFHQTCLQRKMLDFRAIEEGRVAKGDVLTVATTAGIAGAKKTWEMIPMCHIVPLTGCAIEWGLDKNDLEIKCRCTVRCTGKTGVEMEALTGVSTALLTVYDMCKALDRDMEIDEIRIIEKSGGKSGHFVREV